VKRKICFITSGPQLLLRKTHASTLPDGFRSKDLDQVSTSGLLLPDERANLIGCTCLLALPFERFNRRQDARTRDDPFCNIQITQYTVAMLSTIPNLLTCSLDGFIARTNGDLDCSCSYF
jgi:hypothetical protein